VIDARVLATFCAHGGRVAAARAAFGGADGGGDWIDLSTGIAPWGWPVGDVPLGLDRLPEPDAVAALEAAAARAFGVGDPAGVVAVPGTDLALRLLAGVLPARHAAVLQPGYAGHRAAWPDAQPVADLPAPDHDLFVLASPANPDGRVTDPAILRTLAGRMTVVVDQAYADPDPGVCPYASDRLVVLRSFGKFYGLPGLRLGFVVTGPDVAMRLRTAIGDWPVSGPAVAIGTAAYADANWRRAQQARIAETGAMLDAVLAAAGLAIVGTAPLFRLVACTGDLFGTLARHAILTRPFADRPDRLRIGLPLGSAALIRLATALEVYR
jgi:cobalamin biosynthetic protein CobC